MPSAAAASISPARPWTRCSRIVARDLGAGGDRLRIGRRQDRQGREQRLRDVPVERGADVAVVVGAGLGIRVGERLEARLEGELALEDELRPRRAAGLGRVPAHGDAVEQRRRGRRLGARRRSEQRQGERERDAEPLHGAHCTASRPDGLASRHVTCGPRCGDLRGPGGGDELPARPRRGPGGSGPALALPRRAGVRRGRGAATRASTTPPTRGSRAPRGSSA